METTWCSCWLSPPPGPREASLGGTRLATGQRQRAQRHRPPRRAAPPLGAAGCAGNSAARAARPHVCCLHHGLHMYRIHDRIGVSARSPRLSPRAAPRRRPWGLRQSIALERSKTPTAVLTNAVTLAGRSLAAELLDSFWTSRRGTSSAHAPRPRWTAYERVARDQA